MGMNKNELDETDTSCLVVHGAASFIDGAPTLEISWCTMKFNSVSHTHFEISAVDAFGIFADRRCRSRTSVSFASGPST
jgi:hypothetical protein